MWYFSLGYTGAFYGGKGAQATETAESKSQMERDITRSMFAIRMAEMKTAWFNNRSVIIVLVCLDKG